MMVAVVVERLRRSGPATLETEDMMTKPFNKAALARMSDAERLLLHARTYDALLASDPLTDARRDALAALDMIEIEYGNRCAPGG